MDFKSTPLEIISLKAGTDGWEFSAYASTFGNRDHTGDIVSAGAFTQTLKARKRRPLLWQHDMHEPIGIERSLRQDSKGLLGTWDIVDTQRGTDVYKLLKRGAVDSMSIGYIPESFEFEDEGQTRVLKGIDLLENSVVSIPANEQARIQSVKSHIHCATCEAVIDEAKATWTTAYINNLPDSAFAAIEGGGKKDSEGKTVPRSLRHYPHHNAQGGLDLPHLRAALSRVGDSSNFQGGKAHLASHARSAGVGQAAASVDETLPEHEGFDLATLSYSELVEHFTETLALLGESTRHLLGSLPRTDHGLSESKRADLELFLGSFPGLDAVRSDVEALLHSPEPPVQSALQVRFALAKLRAKRSGVEF